MVYNYDSILEHLCTAHVLQVDMGAYSDQSLAAEFRQSTDSPDCPVSHCYGPNDFVRIVCSAGFLQNLMSHLC